MIKMTHTESQIRQLNKTLGLVNTMIDKCGIKKNTGICQGYKISQKQLILVKQEILQRIKGHKKTNKVQQNHKDSFIKT